MCCLSEFFETTSELKGFIFGVIRFQLLAIEFFKLLDPYVIDLEWTKQPRVMLDFSLAWKLSCDNYFRLNVPDQQILLKSNVYSSGCQFEEKNSLGFFVKVEFRLE